MALGEGNESNFFNIFGIVFSFVTGLLLLVMLARTF